MKYLENQLIDKLMNINTILIKKFFWQTLSKIYLSK